MATVSEQRGKLIPRKHRVFSLEEVSLHADQSSCWVVIKDRVYDLTDFVAEIACHEILDQFLPRKPIEQRSGVAARVFLKSYVSFPSLGAAKPVVTQFYYAASAYVAFQHPGGSEIMLEHAGWDATTVFEDIGHSANAVKILAKYYIGELREEDRIYDTRPRL